MKIKAKLQSGFGIVGFLFAITILFMLYSFNKFNNSLKFITDVKMKGSMSIANMNTQTSNHMIQAFMHSTTSSESEMAKVEGEIKRLNGIIEAEMKVYEPLMTNNIEKDLLTWSSFFVTLLRLFYAVYLFSNGVSPFNEECGLLEL